MRIIVKFFLFVFALFLVGCDEADEMFSVRRTSVDVGEVSVGDSVVATFSFKNNTRQELSVSFMPECDCTTVDREFMILGPRKGGQLRVKVAVENPGEFVKYVFAQASGSEDFITVAVRWRTK